MTKAKLKFDNDLNLDNFLNRDNAKNKLIDLCNQRYDEIENLKEIVNQYASDPKRENLANEIIKLKTENQKLKSENITLLTLVENLKVEMRVARSFLDYENNDKLRFEKGFFINTLS